MQSCNRIDRSAATRSTFTAWVHFCSYPRPSQGTVRRVAVAVNSPRRAALRVTVCAVVVRGSPPPPRPDWALSLLVAPHVIGHRPGGGCPHVGRWPSPLVSAAAPTRGVVRGEGGGPGGKGTRRPPCASSLRVRAFRCRDVSPPPPSRPPPTCRRGLPRSPAACPAAPAARAGVGRDPADEPAAGAPAWPPRAATRRWPHGGGSGLLYLLPLPPPVSCLAPPLLFSPPPLPVLLRPPLRFRRAAEASPVGRCGRPPPFSPSPVPAISCFPMHLRPPIIRSSALS